MTNGQRCRYREVVISKIVSGGQTGADRAALDWAIDHGVPHGGWCPKGRLAEDGPIPARYQLQEMPSKDYLRRTEQNIIDSDGTVIFTCSAKLTGGSKRTAEFAVKHRKPWLHVRATEPMAVTVEAVRAFVDAHRISVLNVAGSRGSKEPEVGAFVRDVLSGSLLDQSVHYAEGEERLYPADGGPPPDNLLTG